MNMWSFWKICHHQSKENLTSQVSHNTISESLPIPIVQYAMVQNEYISYLVLLIFLTIAPASPASWWMLFKALGGEILHWLFNATVWSLKYWYLLLILNVKAVVEQGKLSQIIIRTLLSESEDEIKYILYFKPLLFMIMLYASAVLKVRNGIMHCTNVLKFHYEEQIRMDIIV